MAQMDDPVIRALLQLRAQLTDLEPGDRDAIARVGADLEEVVAALPAEMADAAELLNSALEGLQQLYFHQASDGEARLQEIAETLAAVGERLGAGDLLAGEPDADDVPAEPAEASGAPVEPEEPAPEAEAAPTGATVDDILLLLATLEPADKDGLTRAHRMLADLADDEGASEVARAFYAEAALELDDVVDGTIVDLSDAFAEVDWLLEAAQEAAESPTAAAPAEDVDEAWAETALPPDADRELLGEFITECRENVEGAESALLALESDPTDTESLNTVFRAFHTIKGTSAFLGLERISEFAHHAESLLSRARDNEMQLTGGYADLALRAADMLRALIQGVQDALGGVPMSRPEGFSELMAALADPEAAGITGDADETMATADVPLIGDLLVAQRKVSRRDVRLAKSTQGDQPIGHALIRSGAASVADVAQALRAQRRMQGADAPTEGSIRVRTGRLDSLIEMVGELVIAQSMITADAVVNDARHHELTRKVSQTAKIVRELQDLSMSMRMLPLRATFHKMKRLARDVARKNDKQVNFITEGEDTEIDRSMVDVVKDPLVHMVRNAVDHGIEAPDVREAAGKPRAGTVLLRAYHHGGNVVVELQDDGGGLDRGKIVDKAVAHGLIESDKGMSDSEVCNLIFAPGFSTADQVTEVSGRGVGMDVVKRGVEALRGRVGISSEPGQGSRFTVSLPLTLAVTDGMLVGVAGERYIVPTLNIQMSFRAEPEALSTVAERGEMVMLRGDMLPIVRLHRLFGVAGAIADPTDAILVVLEDGERRCALLVDEILGQQQVVAKSLGEGIGRVPGVSGAAILGDGRVGLILDPVGLSALARQSTGPCRRAEGGASGLQDTEQAVAV